MLAETLRELPDVPSQIKECSNEKKNMDSFNGRINIHMGSKIIRGSSGMEDYEITPRTMFITALCCAITIIIIIETFLFCYR